MILYSYEVSVPFRRATTSAIRRRLRNLTTADQNQIFSIANRRILTTELTQNRLRDMISASVKITSSSVDFSNREGDPFHVAAVISWLLQIHDPSREVKFVARPSVSQDIDDLVELTCSNGQISVQYLPAGPNAADRSEDNIGGESGSPGD